MEKFIKNVLAKTLYFEARGEGERGMRAVATVIYNRAAGNVAKFATVCLAPKQFSCWKSHDGLIVEPSAPADAAAYGICIKIESEMVEGTFGPLGSWTHYYNPRGANPSWARNRPFTVIGNHNFLKI